jgi:predicted CXXCH cytochrome family protein
MARGGLMAVLVGGALVLAGVGGAEAQGILNTKHNLASGVGASPSGDIKTTGTNQVCVFCHTPHGAADASTVNAPLWNRAVSNTASYTMYNSPTLDATPSASNMGVSLACLSCHDGTIAFDALRNLPGAGGYNPAPSAAGVTNWTFTNAADKKMPSGRITNIGTDLSNDHPIAMLYADARSPSATDAAETAGFYASATNGTRTTVTGGVTGTAVPLYEGRVQCASCHDPHRSNTETFLRVTADQSQICRTCHKKDG